MKLQRILNLTIAFAILILANCISFAHYEANYLPEDKDIRSSKVLLILPSYSDHIAEEIYYNPFAENQRKNALSKPKQKGGIVEITVDPRKQFQDSAARKSFKLFLEGTLYSSLKTAISTENPSVQYLDEKDEKRLATEIQKTFKNPFAPISPALRDELKKKNIEYVLAPLAFSTPGNELFTKAISAQQNNNNNNNNNSGGNVQTKTSEIRQGGSIVGVRLQLIDLQSGENEKISTIYIQWNFADSAKSKFQESILKLVQGIFPPKS
ncbi:hypothetical protein [Leptospira kmetyi]|uniref:hypothetical protein n=1 Tax=Leptospira kmetyi TaxID=408139 RepID=UPI000287B37F|nr:hypothetical protein [Leptospira kmetyi]EQA51743.1 hypothetical protein LEP1GSC052_0853 [Leptospira kmetyi serovar Malaysia str. Bejo-Iso9]TGK13658.1 hypothetical protein EHO62_18160 [Leptospira kmetyi]TGK29143.1 hypothetical protein EHO66_10155 [Leptospira kmetyi]TGL71835.1 hypothetical protein EHQ67_01610 [Leptospira kmetyi]